MDDSQQNSKDPPGTELREPTFRERLELILLLVVEVLCLLLFIDFLFIGYYIK